MITARTRSHKSGGAAAPLLLLLLTALLAAGCGGEASDGPARLSDEARALDAAVDDTALRGWLDLARRLAAQDPPEELSYDHLYAEPAYRLSFGQRRGLDFNRPMMRRALKFTFLDGGRGDRGRVNNPDLLANYAYLAERLDDAAGLADSLHERQVLTRAYDRVLPYLDAAQRPDSLRLRLLAATPSVSWYPPGDLMLDAGLALAAGPGLEAVLASSLYRHLAAPAMADPVDFADGRGALLATLAQLQRRSVLAELGDFARMRYDPAHPVLGGGAAPDEHGVLTAAEAMARVQDMLATLVDPAQDAVLRANGGSVDDYLRLGGLYDVVGHAAAALIRDRLGDEGWLRAARGTTLDWLRAYQEAAGDGGATGYLSQLPPFDPTTWSRLEALIASPRREVPR